MMARGKRAPNFLTSGHVRSTPAEVSKDQKDDSSQAGLGG